MLLDKAQTKEIVLSSLIYLSANDFCTIYGFVLMPNHVHLLIGLNQDNKNRFQHRFLKYTAQQIIREMKTNSDAVLDSIVSTQADRKYQFWERRPKWIAIEHSDIFWQKLSYIHNNPVQPRWNLAALPEEYSFSSASSYYQGHSIFEFLQLYA